MIFALATKKDGKVSEFDIRQNDIWTWEINLKRNVFDWERDQWESFLQTLDSASRSVVLQDCIRWSGASDGQYSAKAYCAMVQGTTHDSGQCMGTSMNFRVPNTHKNDTKRVIWTPPPCGAVKFNEDAGVVGSNGKVGIGGILSSLVIFSKSAGLMDPALVEVLAIKEALTIYSACKWGQSRDIIEILREANGTADRLAKAGINRKVNLLS
ncbi:hypothetical protein Godav_004878, partial [Gossypium davidsonii]|nr:hypothetical protein [Gossypium davidsonii]